MPNLGYETFESEWIDHPDLKNKVAELCTGEVLTLPCGRSPIGDVRADVDGSLEPDVLADLRQPPFPPNSFDTVYCDPPYSMFDFGKSTAWVGELYRIARRRLIIQGSNKKLSVPGPDEKSLYLLEPKPGSTKHWIRSLHVFDHPDTSVSDF